MRVINLAIICPYCHIIRTCQPHIDSGNVGIGTAAPASTLHVGLAPTASANYGLVSLGMGATGFDGATAGKFVGSANGTVQAINVASTYAGNLVDYQVGGVSKFKVDNAGVITGNGTGLNRKNLVEME